MLDSGKALCLFDGRRAHAVDPFVGERYSLVFFCTSAYTRARPAMIELVSSLGGQMPTSASLQRAMHYLAPPKGEQQRSIREVCGQGSKPTFVKWSTPNLLNIDCILLDKCLSYLLAPALMSTICAVSKAV